MDQDNNSYLSQGEVVSPKLSYINSKFNIHLFNYGIAIDLTPTGFVIIQDIYGEKSYMKLSEIDKIGK